ncbi:MAG: class I SAM-dependent methyltransferase [Myxococcaceae bacterium]
MKLEGLRVFEDDDEHVALVTKTLRISHQRWREVVQRWCDETPANAPMEQRLSTLGRAFTSALPPLSGPCPLCDGSAMACTDDGALTMGRCSLCGHGVLLRGAAPPSTYDARYYETKRLDGAGYDAYAAERGYREQKGRRLIERLQALEPSARLLLEVGSGFGFTRAAAEGLGLHTTGVDVNPTAVATCRALYGFDTITGTCRDVAGQFDVVLYQFVLEHIANVRAELNDAFARCAPGGLVCVIVPSMDAVEREVFAAKYRSFRADHLHVFSRRSIEALLVRADFTDVRVTSECNLHLLEGFLSHDECTALYARGLGPDLVVTARRR